MTNDHKTAAEQQILAEVQKISKKMDALDGRFDKLEAESRKAGAIAGGIAGGVTGGFIAVGFALIKAKLGY